MKYISKRPEPDELTRWKSLANNDWIPTYDELSGKEKAAVKTALMEEQGYICCYCERRLSERDSHIEHFKPQSDPAVDPLDYQNLLCSCQNQLKKGEPRHCGNLKEDWFDENLLVSPMSEECEQSFTFHHDGTIHPSNGNQKAKTTIKKLGLDLPKLNSLRAAAIEPFLDEELDESELNEFVEHYLQIDSNGRFEEFWTTIKNLFEPISPNLQD